MSDPGLHIEPRDAKPRSRRIGLALAATPPALLATAAIAGIGLERDASAPLAFGAALALALLPAWGLAAGRGLGSVAHTLACWVWCTALLLVLPVYFPGERAAATARGLRAVTDFTGETLSGAAARAGAGLVGLLGEDATAGAVISRPAPGGDLDPAPAKPTAGPRKPRPAPAVATLGADDGPERTVYLPYEGDQTSLQVRVDVDGPVVGEQLDMIFDTGATFTTLDRATLERLDVTIPADAPRITLRTANGAIEAPLALVDAVWLGDEPIEWVTIAVCDSCVNPPAVGLLGLNVTRRFRVSIDHDRRRIELAPRQRPDDRALDLRQWLTIRSQATRRWRGAVDVVLTARNRSRRPIAEAVVDLTCGEQTVAVQIDDIPPRGERRTEITLPRGTDCSRQSIVVSRGRWLLDRF